MNLDRFGPIAKAFVSLLVILGFFGIISALFYMALSQKDFPPGINETLLVLVGVLAGEFKNVCSYWLGSTHSSSRKTEIIAATGPAP
jgi:hypothetical protein